MLDLLRIAVILGGITFLFVLLFANKYVVANYWLPAVIDEDPNGESDPDEP